jgi:hypothetical protein
MFIPTDLLKAALVCASSEETRYYLRGIHLSTSGHMVTTDGHRMFVARLAERPTADVIVPCYAVAAALKMAGARCEEIEIDLAANRIGQIQYTPVDGTFPDWRHVVPTGEETPSTKPDANDGPEHVHFDHRYVGDFAKMVTILCGKASTTQITMINAFAAQSKAIIKRTNMKPPQVARYPDSLLMGKAKDAGFIMDGGFR